MLANDALNRRLTRNEADPNYERIHVRYTGNDDVRTISTHDLNCFEGSDEDLKLRYTRRWLYEEEGLQNAYLRYLIKARVTDGGAQLPYTKDPNLISGNGSAYMHPVVYNEAILRDLKCAREHKWRLTADTIYRKDCNCSIYFEVVTAVYRLWRCTATGYIDPIGLASVTTPTHLIESGIDAWSKARGQYLNSGGRDYWFPHRKGKLSSSEFRKCTFSNDSMANKGVEAVFALTELLHWKSTLSIVNDQ